MNWPQSLRQSLQHQACVLVTMNLILGSAPRESGCRMIVTEEGIIGSIGGGNLEFTAMIKARELLGEASHAKQCYQPFGLGPALNQCCGGAVTLLFELMQPPSPVWLLELCDYQKSGLGGILMQAIDRQEPIRFVLPLSANIADIANLANTGLPEAIQAEASRLQRAPAVIDPNEAAITVLEAGDETWWLERVEFRQPAVFLFGAGHVGREVADLLSRLPFALHWTDSRKDPGLSDTGSGLMPAYSEDPLVDVRLAPPGSLFVVMTHSHQLDEEICFEILSRKDFCWLGLIGSDTKRRRFVQRLNKRGISAEILGRLNCPIGLAGIGGKQPATIALSLAAQLMMEKPWMIENS